MEQAEKRELIKKVREQVMEQVYRSLPDIVANLATSAQSHAERFVRFYEEHPEFKEHTEIVGTTVSKIEGEDPIRPYDEMLKLAVPEIRKAIEQKNKVSMEPPGDLSADRKFIENVGKI